MKLKNTNHKLRDMDAAFNISDERGTELQDKFNHVIATQQTGDITELVEKIILLADNINEVAFLMCGAMLVSEQSGKAKAMSDLEEAVKSRTEKEERPC